MKILKIFGVVVAVHAAVFMFVFAIPGCSTKSRPAPQEPAPDTGTATPSVSYPGAPAADAGAAVAGTETPAPEGMPQVSFNSQRYNPTRPGSSAAGVLQSSDVTGVTPASTYKVQPNDSLWKVAKKHGLGVEDLAKANGLKPNAPLKVGQKLIVPGKSPKSGAAPSGTRIYTVKAGDSLGMIARKQSTTVADIRSLNPDLRNDTVRAGQELVLPASGKSVAAGASSSSVSAPPVLPSSAVTAPGGSIEHVVQPGEGLQQIARKYGVPQREIAVTNQISDPKSIRAGQKLIIPGVKTPGTTEPIVTPPAEQTPVAPANPVETPVSPAPEASPVAPSEAPPVVKVDESTPVTPVAPAP